MGRWMSPDWSAEQEPVPYAKLDDPQSLNLYSYAGNNPLGRFDLDGHFGLSNGGPDVCNGSPNCRTDGEKFSAAQKAQQKNNSQAGTLPNDPSGLGN